MNRFQVGDPVFVWRADAPLRFGTVIGFYYVDHTRIQRDFCLVEFSDGEVGMVLTQLLHRD